MYLSVCKISLLSLQAEHVMKSVYKTAPTTGTNGKSNTYEQRLEMYQMYLTVQQTIIIVFAAFILYESK